MATAGIKAAAYCLNFAPELALHYGGTPAQERKSSEKRWEIARRKQADSGEVHSVHMDSCEDRLESLKVLYDAGILDREEYAQRVARVKKAHAQSRG